MLERRDTAPHADSAARFGLLRLLRIVNEVPFDLMEINELGLETNRLFKAAGAFQSFARVQRRGTAGT
jgi:hypothetical protein